MICKKTVLVAFIALMVWCVEPIHKKPNKQYPIRIAHPLKIKQDETAPVYIARRSPEKRKRYRVALTAYVAPKNPVTGRRTRTATMKRPIVGETIAVSRDLRHLLGRTVYIKGIGHRKVTDLMHWRWSYKMDVLLATRSEAIKFGIKQNVKVIVL